MCVLFLTNCTIATSNNTRTAQERARREHERKEQERKENEARKEAAERQRKETERLRALVSIFYSATTIAHTSAFIFTHEIGN